MAGWEMEESDYEDLRKKGKAAKQRSALERIADMFGFAKTASDIKKNPERIDVMNAGESCYDRNGNLKKCD